MMIALVTKKIQKTKPLIILQRLLEKDRAAVKGYVDADGNAVWLRKQVTLGDEAAFARLYNTTGGLMFGLLLRLLSDSRAAEEMLQNIYAEFRQETVRFDRERENSFVWLIAVAHRQGIEHLPLNRQFEVFKTSNGNGHLPFEVGKSNNHFDIKELF